MALDIGGLVGLLVFYALILAMGIWASKKSRKEEKKCVGSRTHVTILGGRNISLWIGVFTMTATWVGGGYILGTAEAAYTPSRGLVWALVPPLAYFLNLSIGGLFFAKPMRSQRFVTMMDPFHRRYGNGITTILLLPILICELLWVAIILLALGGTVSVVLDLPSSYAIIVSAAVACIYTLLGGFYSVAYTDVIQLVIIFISMWLCVPFLLLNPSSSPSSSSSSSSSSSNVTLTPLQYPSWLGELKMEDAGKWMDELLSLTLGGLCYQAFYQRILSAASNAQAQITSLAAALPCLILGIPSIIIGAVASTADWNQTQYGLPPPFERGEAGNVLPLALQNFTPYWVSVLGIGAISAAVMSSMDSVLLAVASLFTHNIYKNLLRKQASDRECAWVIRISVLLAGVAGTGLAFSGEGVLSLWLLISDLQICMIFPQIVCVLHCSRANGYGAAAGLVLGTLLRLLSGVPILHLPPVLLFPGWEEDELTGEIIQRFPFRTLVMLLTLLVIVSCSLLARLVFARHMLPRSWDLLGEDGDAIGLRNVNGVKREDVDLAATTENLPNPQPATPTPGDPRGGDLRFIHPAKPDPDWLTASEDVCRPCEDQCLKSTAF